MLTYCSRETVRGRVRFTTSLPWHHLPFLVVRFSLSFSVPCVRFSVLAYGHLQGSCPAAVFGFYTFQTLIFPTIPPSHRVACPTRVREITGNEADAA